jgi:hypothetical protein
MKSFKFAIIAFALVSLFSACIEHEVIPPPTNKVDLNASLVGYVNGTQFELTQNVNGYKSSTWDTSVVLASPALSKVIYSSTIYSNQNSQSLNLMFGTLDYDAAANTEPTLSMFNDWNMTNSGIPILFKDKATMVSQSVDGVQVTYTDNTGKIWFSRETDPGQVASFTILKQASDGTGDYSLFEATFSCKVWYVDPQTSVESSLNITNAKYRAWFKR